MNWLIQNNETYKETEINGIRMEYDGCSDSRTLEDALSFYTADQWEYLGASAKMWINGVKQSISKNYFFFKLKPLPLENLQSIDNPFCLN